jgi:hypothetical protein
MAYTTINKSSEHFNTKTYTGNASTQAITGVGFQPDLVWIKNRVTTNSHVWQDSVRGADKTIYSNSNSAQDTGSTNVGSFDSDGFTLGSNGGTNGNGNSIVSWNWKAGTTGSGTSTGSGTGKAYTYSVNTTGGFSIIKYIGNGSGGHTIPHHLGATPEFIIIKNLDSTADWRVYHVGVASANTRAMRLNSNDYYNTDTAYWNDTSPSSTVFTLGSSSELNGNNVNYIAYCYTPKTGYSKFGYYLGTNQGANGPFVYTGFKPAWVMIKLASHSGAHWNIKDIKRDYNELGPGANPIDNQLKADATTAETNGEDVDYVSNGFKIKANGLNIQDSDYRYIYMAFGQSLVGSNNIPCLAR